tara:strand:+ start:836 stop:1873 length:1038 start_codon:yes stop_codon:yes gene_type:complete
VAQEVKVRQFFLIPPRFGVLALYLSPLRPLLYLFASISKKFDLSLKFGVISVISLCIFTLVYSSPALAKIKPQRIISMSPAITEILFAIGAGNRIVGVTKFCNYPEAVKLLPRIGGPLNPSSEQIIKLNPDLLVYHHDSYKMSRFGKQLGVRAVSVSFDNLKDIYHSINIVGRATGNLDGSESLISKLKNQVASYRKHLRNLKPKTTLLILSDSQNPMRDLYAAGEGTFLDELLTIAGGNNIVQNSLILYPKISREYIIAQSPEVILVAGPSANLTEKQLILNKKKWERLSSVRAVKDNRVHYIGADYILIPGPRLIQIVDQFTKALHPKAVSQKPKVFRIPEKP